MSSDESGDDESSDVLRNRFRSHQPDDTDGADGTSDTDDAGETDGTSEADEATVRERQQVAMYLRPGQKGDLEDFYEKLDGRSKVAGEGGLAKNDDFYENAVAFILDERREEFIEYLGLKDL